MRETIAVVLVVLWLLALVSGHTMGNFVHLLPVAAIMLFVWSQADKSTPH